eukprot:Filipodium_phascolosomae@DN3448_c0_g1_i1.p2
MEVCVAGALPVTDGPGSGLAVAAYVSGRSAAGPPAAGATQALLFPLDVALLEVRTFGVKELVVRVEGLDSMAVVAPVVPMSFGINILKGMCLLCRVTAAHGSTGAVPLVGLPKALPAARAVRGGFVAVYLFDGGTGTPRSGVLESPPAVESSLLHGPLLLNV